MKYIFSIYVYGQKISSKPLTREELEETIRVNLNNDITDFEVERADIDEV